MIFNRFFTPAYRSDKPETRLKAIETLSPGKPQDKTILHELAFNDASSDVTLAALRRLNSFALWQKMAMIGHTERVKREAEKQVESMLRGDIAASVSDAERRAFLQESASAALIGEMLLSDTGLHDDPSFVLGLLSRVGDSMLTQQVFHATPNPELQRVIIDDCSDIDLLSRLQRKVTDDAVHAQLAARIDTLVAAQQKPIQLKKTLTLCLSKYQALLEKDDYPDIIEKAAVLETEYHALMADKACLATDERNETEGKYERIRAQVQRHCERLKPQWQAQQAIRQAQAMSDEAASRLSELGDALATLYDQHLLTATADDLASVNTQLSQLADILSELASMTTGDTRLTALKKRYQQYVIQRDQFSQQQQAAAAALTILEQAESFFSAIDADQDITTESQQRASALARQWRESTAGLRIVPKDWTKRWNSGWSHWSKTLKSQQAASDAQQKSCRKQLNIIDSQIEKGRFRSAMRAFEALKSDYFALPEDVRNLLAKRFSQTQAAVERLEGWQSYLAAPRKPALLEDAKTLAEQAPDDITGRAEAIRYLREQWKSLGNTGDEQDAQNNAQFDRYLEQAFAPCREYYAAQEQRREQAIEQRRGLIERTGLLADIDDPAILAKELEKLSDQWHGAAQVDAKRYRKLKMQWDKAVAPHKQRVTDWHHQNRETKHALIGQARALAEADDIDAAAGEAQLLQQRWKQTGHAGRRAESSLWHSFKEANDALFAQVKEKRRATRDVQNQAANALLDKVDELIHKAEHVSADEIRKAVSELDADSYDLAGSAKRTLHKKLGELNKRLEAQVSQKQQAAKQARYSALLTLLEGWNNGEARTTLGETAYQRLGKRWQQACESGEASAYTRSWLTTALEIHTSMPSPAYAAEERQAVQLELLSAKLAQGEKWSLDGLIAHWLCAGAITSTEIPLADRVAQVVREQQQK